jgi:hypothetical protein
MNRVSQPTKIDPKLQISENIVWKVLPGNPVWSFERGQSTGADRLRVHSNPCSPMCIMLSTAAEGQLGASANLRIGKA